jgi:hypothetical protein
MRKSALSNASYEVQTRISNGKIQYSGTFIKTE